MSNLSNINPDVLVILSTLVTVIATQSLSSNDLNVIGNVVSQIAQTILTKAAQVQSLESNEDLKQQICDM
jgi:hypothetical protein